MKKLWFFALAWAAMLPALAQTIAVSGAWARATVPGQHGTGAFMTLVAPEGARLTGAASAVAGVVEIHEMTMEGNVMKMRAISGLDLPPGSQRAARARRLSRDADGSEAAAESRGKNPHRTAVRNARPAADHTAGRSRSTGARC
jgi:hypothetical protein